MRMDAVQSGSSQISTLDQDISHVLLVVGVGILTYEIVSKVVHKVASDTLSKKFLASLVTSAVVMTTVYKMELSDLQGQFIFICVVYVVVSIWANYSKKINGSSLPDYMLDMVEEAKKGAYLSKIGYESAVKRVEILMNKKTKANAILIADPGVGKSTIPETIAYKIATVQYSPRSVFFNAKLVRVDFTDLVAGTIYHGSLQQRVKEMVHLAKGDRKIIYFIDEIYTLVGGGYTLDSARVDVSEMLLPVMARGDIRILGAATFQDYNLYIAPKAAFARRLPQVLMDEPTHAQCFKMLQYSYAQISEQSRIKISHRAIAAAIFFSKDIQQRYLPDKAIDLIDDAISSAELELDDTENALTLTDRDIAAAWSSCNQGLNVETLTRTFSRFVNQHSDYFPGLVNGDVD